MPTSAQVRQQLIEALQLDLIGPTPDHSEDYQRETLPQSPSKWYLTGFLAPSNAPLALRSDDIADDELEDAAVGAVGEDNATPERAATRKGHFPASMGISFLIPPELQSLDVTVTWGDYFPTPEEVESNDEQSEASETLTLTADKITETTLQKEASVPWQRIPKQESVTLDLSQRQSTQTCPLGDNQLSLVVYLREITSHHFAPGTCSVSVFLVNNRKPIEGLERDMAYIFQTQLSVTSQVPFVPRANLQGSQDAKTEPDWDEAVAHLQYRNDFEYGVGHNVSVLPELVPDGNCYQLQTTWTPQAVVNKVQAANIPDVELGMETLAAAPDLDTLRQYLENIPIAYGQWIEQQRKVMATLTEKQGETARDLYRDAERIKGRIQAGIDCLTDPDALEAFQQMNQAIAVSIRQRLSHNSDKKPSEFKPPQWRPFQLAFILMNLRGMVDPTHGDRQIVDLLFFPTGGGKTEAYLGLAAFTLILRRLRHPDLAGAGLSVIMRYTLRLLTLDQLSRAATLICALELERQKKPTQLGSHPFEIGLWVGQGATPNRMGVVNDQNPDSARSRTIAFQNNPKGKPSPIPMEDCPWCGTKFNDKTFELVPNVKTPRRLIIKCSNRDCEFTSRNPLPIVAVDDVIYRRLPCFMISTVDKFANLPWVGETANLFGKVTHYDPKEKEFFGVTQPGGYPLPTPQLPPPDLIIQDELHLISGPLGTMVGLYEAAIEHLCCSQKGDQTIKPKIVASTATVRRATEQIRALFARPDVDVFPPPGGDHHDSFFAKTVPATEANPRLYLGIAAQGRSLKVVLLRTYLALLGAAQKAWIENGGHKNPDNPVDPYMTLLGYFNSLRELGGSRRIVEDEVVSQLSQYSQRRRLNFEEGLFGDRQINNEPSELTSRETTNKVAETKRRLSLNHTDKERVDVALATNMISVGLDITRLGLMVVLGQPKATAEYIQSTSRVGRDDQRPGLVVTLLNIHRPRDRSHYERFKYWHDTFYRSVEATSVTPFSPRALDRGLAGVTVALSRLGHPEMTPAKGAQLISEYRRNLEYIADLLSRRAEEHNKNVNAEDIRRTVRGRIIKLLDTWEKIIQEYPDLQYQKEEKNIPRLLHDFLDDDLANKPTYMKEFRAQRSLRDVEPTVNLWVKWGNRENDE